MLASLPPDARVAVFRALQLGDLLCAVPALRALRGALPRAQVTLIGLPWAHAFARRYSGYVDRFVEFPGHRGMPERAPDEEAFAGFVARLRAERLDAAIQLHGDGSLTNGIVAQLGARSLFGFCPPCAPPPAPGLLPYPGEGTEVERLLKLMEFLGAPRRGGELEFPFAEEDFAQLAARPALRALPPNGYVCLHPGARHPSRRWPVAQFARVGDALHAELGARVVITGSQAEAPLAAELARAMRSPAVQAACDISVGGLALIIRGARLLVTNDTGASHIAAALGVPSVVIFRDSELARWAPADRALHRPVWDPEGARLEEVLKQARLLVAARARPSLQEA